MPLLNLASNYLVMEESVNRYLPLALKYRPKNITELKGQEVLVTTLKNAFELKRISPAFMLTGVRGVGKTTTARILAKAFNCIGLDGHGEPTLTPCEKCESCTTINNEKNLDVLEMDAASKTGVDDIRELIDSVAYKPISSRYKVYIIDEVHMLSKNAFNALLKTLEEPPSHVKFIFATTELKKVPITIISRCQIFHLKRLNITELCKHLSYVCDQESVRYTGNALKLIASSADGSVRDSLSILDQAISNTSAHLTESNVIKLLGVSQKDSIYILLQNLLTGKLPQAVAIIEDSYSKGLEMTTIFEELLEVCHLLTMLKTLDSPSDVSEINALTAGELKEATSLSQQVNLSYLVMVWQILIKTIDEIKLSSFPKKAAEMALVKIIWASEASALPAIAKMIKSTAAEEVSTNAQKLASSTGKKDDTMSMDDLKELFPSAITTDKK